MVPGKERKPDDMSFDILGRHLWNLYSFSTIDDIRKISSKLANVKRRCSWVSIQWAKHWSLGFKLNKDSTLGWYRNTLENSRKRYKINPWLILLALITNFYGSNFDFTKPCLSSAMALSIKLKKFIIFLLQVNHIHTEVT